VRAGTREQDERGRVARGEETPARCRGFLCLGVCVDVLTYIRFVVFLYFWKGGGKGQQTTHKRHSSNV
jgi:hypothetical protein